LRCRVDFEYPDVGTKNPYLTDGEVVRNQSLRAQHHHHFLRRRMLESRRIFAKFKISWELRKPQESSSAMCDYSLHHVKSRPAKVGDKLRTVNFNTGTRGFASPDDRTTAVCVLPGTELAFSQDVKWAPFSLLSWRVKVIESRTAIFRQVNKDIPRVHHDTLEFADGTHVLLTDLLDGQEATVLQLPAQPKTPAEEAAQRRVTSVG
jgi:hypothetical protein